MDAQLLAISPSEMPKHSDSTDSLIRKWLFRFSIEHKEDIAPRLPLWLEAFDGMDPIVLEGLFKRALNTCRFFPKISEILEPIKKAEETAVPQAAAKAWEQVLEVRRLYWNPDMPKGFRCRVALLPDRVQQAARAAGVFRDFESEEGLHVWARKRFVESFAAYGELERDQFLLPDGDIKNLLTGLGQAKALPAPSDGWYELRERGEAYRAEMTVTTGNSHRKPAAATHDTPKVVDFEGRTAELRRQAELIRQKYPNTGSASAPAELQSVWVGA